MSAVAAETAPPRPGLRARPWWPWLRKGLWIAFFALLGTLLVNQARSIDWPEVADTLRALPVPVLLAAGGLALASHLLYATFDLLGRHAVGHRLSTPTVMAVTFVSYAFNLNMGALVGGVASRYRLYGRLGLGELQITRVLVLSMVTNWLGYLLLGGLAFALFPLALPAEWDISDAVLQIAGGLLAAMALAYVAACAFSRRRSLTLRGHAFALPSGRTALLQLAMSCTNWSLIAGTIYVLLQGSVDYVTVLTVLLLAAVAGVVTHVPAGLGVLEAVFVALLGTQIPPAQLIGTLLAYRALYYLAPLALAVLTFLILELRQKARSRTA
ncbi:lysylphosphatidylglycerol synthase domain-containing protein [Pseudorhodoferax sp.]|uniref:lysylphosphatidylglycerol synthase domain-containing protein n=1 Tax=Pseudorhodoferax sp. TaxID=1993553 RepID=UPI002DD66EC3|nr:lysylphosphatidylglycerol synthase domain-containing protein [Pseudorhodoferax sp.]